MAAMAANMDVSWEDSGDFVVVSDEDLDLDEFENFIEARKRSTDTLARRWRHIIEKYSNPNLKSDVVDLENLVVVVDNGHLESADERPCGRCPLQEALPLPDEKKFWQKALKEEEPDGGDVARVEEEDVTVDTKFNKTYIVNGQMYSESDVKSYKTFQGVIRRGCVYEVTTSNSEAAETTLTFSSEQEQESEEYVGEEAWDDDSRGTSDTSGEEYNTSPRSSPLVPHNHATFVTSNRTQVSSPTGYKGIHTTGFPVKPRNLQDRELSEKGILTKLSLASLKPPNQRIPAHLDNWGARAERPVRDKLIDTREKFNFKVSPKSVGDQDGRSERRHRRIQTTLIADDEGVTDKHFASNNWVLPRKKEQPKPSENVEGLPGKNEHSQPGKNVHFQARGNEHSQARTVSGRRRDFTSNLLSNDFSEEEESETEEEEDLVSSESDFTDEEDALSIESGVHEIVETPPKPNDRNQLTDGPYPRKRELLGRQFTYEKKTDLNWARKKDFEFEKRRKFDCEKNKVGQEEKWDLEHGKRRVNLEEKRNCDRGEREALDGENFGRMEQRDMRHEVNRDLYMKKGDIRPVHEPMSYHDVEPSPVLNHTRILQANSPPHVLQAETPSSSTTNAPFKLGSLRPLGEPGKTSSNSQRQGVPTKPNSLGSLRKITENRLSRDEKKVGSDKELGERMDGELNKNRGDVHRGAQAASQPIFKLPHSPMAEARRKRDLTCHEKHNAPTKNPRPMSPSPYHATHDFISQHIPVSAIDTQKKLNDKMIMWNYNNQPLLTEVGLSPMAKLLRERKRNELASRAGNTNGQPCKMMPNGNGHPMETQVDWKRKSDSPPPWKRTAKETKKPKELPNDVGLREKREYELRNDKNNPSEWKKMREGQRAGETKLCIAPSVPGSAPEKEKERCDKENSPERDEYHMSASTPTKPGARTNMDLDISCIQSTQPAPAKTSLTNVPKSQNVPKSAKNNEENRALREISEENMKFTIDLPVARVQPQVNAGNGNVLKQTQVNPVTEETFIVGDSRNLLQNPSRKLKIRTSGLSGQSPKTPLISKHLDEMSLRPRGITNISNSDTHLTSDSYSVDKCPPNKEIKEVEPKNKAARQTEVKGLQSVRKESTPRGKEAAATNLTPRFGRIELVDRSCSSVPAKLKLSTGDFSAGNHGKSISPRSIHVKDNSMIMRRLALARKEQSLRTSKEKLKVKNCFGSLREPKSLPKEASVTQKPTRQSGLGNRERKDSNNKNDEGKERRKSLKCQLWSLDNKGSTEKQGRGPKKAGEEDLDGIDFLNESNDQIEEETERKTEQNNRLTAYEKKNPPPDKSRELFREKSDSESDLDSSESESEEYSENESFTSIQKSFSKNRNEIPTAKVMPMETKQEKSTFPTLATSIDAKIFKNSPSRSMSVDSAYISGATLSMDGTSTHTQSSDFELYAHRKLKSCQKDPGINLSRGRQMLLTKHAKRKVVSSSDDDDSDNNIFPSDGLGNVGSKSPFARTLKHKVSDFSSVYTPKVKLMKSINDSSLTSSPCPGPGICRKAFCFRCHVN